LLSATNKGDTVVSGYSMGAQALSFNFEDFVGSVRVDVAVEDDNSVGSALGQFSESISIQIIVEES